MPSHPENEHGRPRTIRLTAAVLADYPEATEVLVSFPERWELVKRLGRPGAPLYLAALPADVERPRRERFYDLPAVVILSTTRHRLYRLFRPWPAPLLTIDWDPFTGRGRVEEVRGHQTHLHEVGQAQAWYGRKYGLVWECYLNEAGREEGWPEDMAAIWRAVEEELGVAKLYTLPHEPTFREGYPEFLARLGYAPDPHSPAWWSKSVQR
jgi:hypothetical protein